MPLALSPLEYRLLAYLALHRERVVAPTELLEHLYGDDDAREANALEALVTRLRRKLGAGVIGTRRGFGYFLEGADAVKLHLAPAAPGRRRRGGGARCRWRSPPSASISCSSATCAGSPSIELSADLDQLAAGLERGRGRPRS